MVGFLSLKVLQLLLSIAFCIFLIVKLTLKFLFRTNSALYDTFRELFFSFYKLIIVTLCLCFFMSVSSPRMALRILTRCDFEDTCERITHLSLESAYVELSEDLLGRAFVLLISVLAAVLDFVYRRIISQYPGFIADLLMKAIFNSLQNSFLTALSGLAFTNEQQFHLFDLDETSFLTTVELRFIKPVKKVLRRIFDSGATTNLVTTIFPGDYIQSTSKVKLALGLSSEGSITAIKRDVVVPDLEEELYCVGSFCEGGGRVEMENRDCTLYERDAAGELILLAKLDIERHCPVLSEETAMKIRSIQRRVLNDDFGC